MRSSDFSVASLHYFIDAQLLPSSFSPIRWIWLLFIKVNIFVLRLSLDRLPTRVNQDRLGFLSLMLYLCFDVGNDFNFVFFSWG